MAFSYTRDFAGVCGNFRFRIFSITDAQSTISVLNTEMNNIFVNSTNTSDNADVMNAKPLLWSSSCDTDVANEIKDTTSTFVEALNGLQAHNNTDGDEGIVSFKDADELLCFKSVYGTAYDLCPDGNEAYTIQSSKHIQVKPATSDDDGTLIVFGR